MVSNFKDIMPRMYWTSNSTKLKLNDLPQSNCGKVSNLNYGHLNNRSIRKKIQQAYVQDQQFNQPMVAHPWRCPECGPSEAQWSQSLWNQTAGPSQNCRHSCHWSRSTGPCQSHSHLHTLTTSSPVRQ